MYKVEDPPFQGLQDGRESKASNHPTQGQIHFAGGQPLVGRFGAAGRGVGGRERADAGGSEHQESQPGTRGNKHQRPGKPASQKYATLHRSFSDYK